MSRKALRDTLTRLHVELESAGPIDAALRAELERTLAEIREVVDREARAGEATSPLAARVESLALRFEQSHPTLTQALAGVVNALGAMGI
jgi:Domain of unknown function (DUF4404)